MAQSSTCPVCSSSFDVDRKLRPRDYEHGISCQADLVGCPNCSSFFLHPRPSEKELATYYPSSYTSYVDPQDPISRFLMRLYYRNEARRFLTYLKPGGCLLDIGCGAGGFLSAFRQQMGQKPATLMGSELDPQAARIAQSLGFQVHLGEFEHSNFSDGSVDVIRLNHVLEHVTDQKRVIQKIFKTLKPGGYLIGETPNVSCVDFSLFRKYWGGIQYPRHTTLFHSTALRNFFETHSFQVRAIRGCYRTLGWSASIQNWLVDKTGHFPGQAGRYRWYPILILATLPITAIQKLFNATAVVEFCVQKPAS